ncbi:MAG: protein tyrosine phosphatase, partial [bacterium]|nr:protein tyrosine phosphatase [bacterium]
MIHITSLADFPGHAAELQPSHVISMLADDGFPATPESVTGENHLRLTFDDINSPLPGHVPPSPDDLERLIAFGRSWNGNGTVISHCFAGVSRSSAAALILLSQVNP